MSKKENFTVIKFIEIRFADPISSVKLENNIVVTGSMMGRIKFYNISENNYINKNELNSENISDISYNERERAFYVGIGDEEIRRYLIDELNEANYQNYSISVYESDLQHTNNCENAFIFLSPESLFRIQLPQIDEGTIKIIKIESEYDFKYFDESKTLDTNEYNYTLPTTNYIVPFDFDGKKFLWVEFMSSTNRNICVANIPLLKNEKPIKYDLNKTIGHICQAKLLPNNRIIFVHSLNKCEIRQLDDKFTLLESFTHNGEEVLAIDVYINQESVKNSHSNGIDDVIFNKNKMNESIEVKNKKKKDIIDTKKHKEEDIYTNRIMETSEFANRNKINNEEENENNNYLYIKQNIKKEKIVDINDICVTTLDIDGNVNLFKNRREMTLFNLYDINTISRDHKDKQFFSMGYAYYIKTNLNYFCITSDHGCYVIKVNNNNK